MHRFRTFNIVTPYFFSVYGVVAELCTGQKKISLEPYEGTGIIYPENYPSIKGYEECVQLLLKSF